MLNRTRQAHNYLSLLLMTTVDWRRTCNLHQEFCHPKPALPLLLPLGVCSSCPSPRGDRTVRHAVNTTYVCCFILNPPFTTSLNGFTTSMVMPASESGQCKGWATEWKWKNGLNNHLHWKCQEWRRVFRLFAFTHSNLPGKLKNKKLEKFILSLKLKYLELTRKIESHCKEMLYKAESDHKLNVITVVPLLSTSIWHLEKCLKTLLTENTLQ